MSDKSVLYKLASIIEKQTEIALKLAQQIVDTGQPITDPLGKIIHDATVAWTTKSGISAKSSFNAGTNGKFYDINVVLTITDLRKAVGAVSQKTKELYKRSFLTVLQDEFNKATKETASPLTGATATFNVTVN